MACTRKGDDDERLREAFCDLSPRPDPISGQSCVRLFGLDDTGARFWSIIPPLLHPEVLYSGFGGWWILGELDWRPVPATEEFEGAEGSRPQGFSCVAKHCCTGLPKGVHLDAPASGLLRAGGHGPTEGC